MFLWFFGGRKETIPSSAILEMYRCTCVSSCIIHGSCCISTMPTFKKGPGTGPRFLYVAPCHLKTSTFTYVVSKAPHVFVLPGSLPPKSKPRFLLCKWYKYSDAAGTQPFGPFAVSMFHRFTERKAPDPGVPWTPGFQPMWRYDERWESSLCER